jgi:hypothetical protein
MKKIILKRGYSHVIVKRNTVNQGTSTLLDKESQ